MPRFVAKPTTIEAYLFNGNIGALPMEFGAHLTQEFTGGPAYLPSTMLLTSDRMDAKDNYSRLDRVDVGDYVYRSLYGFRRMSAAEMEANYEPLEEAVDDITARWRVTYVGDARGHEDVINWAETGVFPYMRSVGVSDPAIAARISLNSHFVVEDTLDDGIPAAIRGADAPQAGAVDRAAIFGDTGSEHLHGDANRHASVAGIGHSDTGSEPLGAAPRRGVGRPRLSLPA